MNALHWDFIQALCLCVRLVTLGQAMRFTGIHDLSNLRRFLKPLEAHGYVRQVVVMAKPVPEMREPLLISESGREECLGELVHEVLRKAKARWAGLSAVPTRCVIATQRGCGLFGVRKLPQLIKPLQASHDLGVSEVLTHYAEHGFEIHNWQSEDVAAFRLGQCIPDAFIVNDRNAPKKVIEIVGDDYDEVKLVTMHHECHRAGVPYELW